MPPIGVDRYSRIVILTGAGVSVASGLPTYRGQGGLYTPEVEWISDGANLPGSLPEVWRLYGGLRPALVGAEPNAAHRAIAAIESTSPSVDRTVTVITQNVDRLHQRAGSTDVVELHGSLLQTRCLNYNCTLKPFEDESVPVDGQVPICPECGRQLRPNIVMFNEELPVDAEWRSKKALRECDLFIAIGTSGSVWPAAGYVSSASYAGARTVYVNPEPLSPPNPYFKETYIGKAEECLPTLLS